MSAGGEEETLLHCPLGEGKLILDLYLKGQLLSGANLNKRRRFLMNYGSLEYRHN
jgi:hypothetical protein